MRSSILQNEDSEKIHLKFTGVEFGIVITKPEKIGKIVITH